MTNSLSPLPKIVRKVEAARRCPNDFAELCFLDSHRRPIRQGLVHRDLQAFLTANRYALVQLPRDHGKSLQICLRILWELGHAPGLRVKMVCASQFHALERSRFLREAIEGNGLVKLVFPGLLPGQPWQAEAFTIDRPVAALGPTLSAFGIGAATTGSRADLLICDDVVDSKALTSFAVREKVKGEFHNNLLHLLEPEGRFWGLSTPWHPDDLNAELAKNSSYKLFHRSVGSNFEPVWPEKWNESKLAERAAEVGEASFARAYRLLPIVEAESLIQAHWIRFWDDEKLPKDFEKIVLAVDPAVSVKEKADASALVVLGRLKHSNTIRVLEAIPRRIAMPDLIHAIDDADRRWRPMAILFESNAAFAGIKDLLIRQARYGPKVKGLVQTKHKSSRVQALSVPVQAGSVLLHRSQRELFEEMTTFPYGRHDDLLDACAFGVDFLLDHPEPRVW